MVLSSRFSFGVAGHADSEVFVSTSRRDQWHTSAHCNAFSASGLFAPTVCRCLQTHCTCDITTRAPTLMLSLHVNRNTQHGVSQAPRTSRRCLTSRLSPGRIARLGWRRSHRAARARARARARCVHAPAPDPVTTKWMLQLAPQRAVQLESTRSGSLTPLPAQSVPLGRLCGCKAPTTQTKNRSSASCERQQRL